LAARIGKTFFNKVLIPSETVVVEVMAVKGRGQEAAEPGEA
jgi:hypothetical protein